MPNLKNFKLPKRKVQNRNATTSSIFTATVKDMASDGRGVISHPNGIVYFVRGVWLGEKATFEITDTNSHPAQAKMLELITPSEHRVTPLCKHFGLTQNDCGGCSWQFIAYSEQLIEKKRHLQGVLSQALNLPVKKLPILDVVPSNTQYGYRNRAQFKTDGKKIGFLGHKSNQLIDVVSCPVVAPKIQQQLNDLREGLPYNRWLPTKKNPFTTLNIDETTDTETLKINERLPFKQGNTQQNTYMQTWLDDELKKILSKAGNIESAVELFCGAGNFTCILSKKCTQVLAYEGDKEAVNALKNNADAQNVEAHCVDLYNEYEAQKAGYQANKATVLVLDPPRAGFKYMKEFVHKAKALHSIIYVSCSCATFTRDASALQEQGFELEILQPVDQFPHTPHVEILACFKKR